MLRGGKQAFHIPLRRKIILYTDNSKEHSTFIQCRKKCKYYVATTILLKPRTTPNYLKWQHYGEIHTKEITK